MNKRYLITLICLAIFSVIASTASVQDYPSKSVNYVIPFGPGGESEITARHQQSINNKQILAFRPTVNA